MNRRHFLGSSLTVAAFSDDISKAFKPDSKSEFDDFKLAGLSLEKLQEQYRKDLFEDYLPFLDRYVIDHEFGGFMCNADMDGKQVNTNKSSWFEGRGIWVYSYLYNNLAPERKYLDIAGRAVEFILKAKPPADELWPKELTREGKPMTSADGEIYGDLFIAEGLAEYSKATAKNEYWHTAKELVLKCVRLYDRPDYRPVIGQTYLGPTAPAFPGARIQGVWMVLIRVVTQMLRMRSDRELEMIASRCVKAIGDHHYNPAFGLINELLNHDLSRPTNEYQQLVYTGHCIENLWMLMDEALRLGDRKLFDTFASWFRRHVEVAWDDVYGGVFRNLQNVDRNTWVLDKVLWAQEEVLIGALQIFEHTGAAWARTLFDRMYVYVRDKYPLASHGSPLWIYASDRKVTYEAFSRMPKRVENYHHPRYLMLNLQSIERMLKRA